MRKLIVSEFVSLDGVMEAPGGEEGFKHTGWVFDFHDSDLLAYKLEEVLAADALLLGRVTYEGFAEAWPSSDMAGFADKMNSMPKHVASTTLNARVEQLEVDRGRCRRWSRSAQARGRRRSPRRRQPDAGAHADRVQPRRRVPPNDLPGRAGERRTSVPRATGEGRAEAGRHEGVRLGGRRPDVPPRLTRLNRGPAEAV